MTLSAPIARDAAPIDFDPKLAGLVQTPRSAEPAGLEKPVVVSPDMGSSFSHLDRAVHAAIARLTGGLSPAALALAFFDWSVHLAASPGKQLALAGEIMGDASRLFETATHFTPTFQPWSLIKPLPNDHRFSDPDWELPPFNMLAQTFLLREKWWRSATIDVRGVARSNAAIADFAIRQYLDTMAPSNFVPLNPEVLRKIMESGGGNFVSGLHNWVEDFSTFWAGGQSKPVSNFAVGKDVAATKGKVVFQNELIELIQYAPTTERVRPEPVLIVPAWIMKYYILDLSPHNSLVKFLVDGGFTVFMISWRNPSADYREFGLDDYHKLGVDAAIAAINEFMPGRSIHAAGYCLGGTLLAIAAARLANERQDCLRSITLLAAQTDFSEAGELTLFINESQIAFLEDMMWQRGVLDTTQMAGAFRMLRSNDLIWSRAVHHYLIGEREPTNDLMSWNADATRMPYRMHSEYLRQLFLNNDLAEGRYRFNGEPLALSDLHAPMFVVGTVWDHVAPWKSTYKIHFLAADADITYALANGGHNAGIVAPPSEEGHSYRLLTKLADGPYIGPDEWIKLASHHEGSWWTAWLDFLIARSGEAVAPPSMGGLRQNVPLKDAPGEYVLQR